MHNASSKYARFNGRGRNLTSIPPPEQAVKNETMIMTDLVGHDDPQPSVDPRLRDRVCWGPVRRDPMGEGELFGTNVWTGTGEEIEIDSARGGGVGVLLRRSRVTWRYAGGVLLAPHRALRLQSQGRLEIARAS